MVKTKPSKAKPAKTNKKKRAKSLLSAPAAASRKGQKDSKPNPFESIWSRRKFDVIGEKRKVVERRVGLARSLAVQKRDRTLLKEYEQSRKSSSFVDRRIGEGDDNLGEYEKALMRLQKERQMKLKRDSKYNLSDGEEDDFDQVDDFDDDVPPSDDDDGDAPHKKDRYLSLDTAQDTLTADMPDGDESVHKTEKQVYQEVMAKSKFHKALKAKEKEDDVHLMEQLDSDFVKLAQSNALLSLTQPTKMNALKSLLNKDQGNLISEDKFSMPAGGKPTKKDKADEYEMLVKEMALDMRARPCDRTKTPEELAQEERERLELLEKERQKRMLGVQDSDDESKSDEEDTLHLLSKYSKHISGDDLGNSFDDGKEKRIGWVDDILEKTNADNDEEDGDASSDDSENSQGSDDDSENDDAESDDDGDIATKDWEQSDDGDDMDFVEVEDQKTEDTGKRKLKHGNEEQMKSQESLPFVIEAPNNLAELCSLLDHRPDDEIVEAINRIRVCTAIKLSAENRRKMQVFYGVLLQYFAVLATKSPLNFKKINLLVRPLMEMSIETPYFAAICARERLTRIRTQFCQNLKDPETSSWPSLKTILLLRLWSLIFPCSDFRHVVMTPATLLICEYLMRCPITNGCDVAVGSFLCSMALSVAKRSQKLYPEALIFLQVLLMTATDMSEKLLKCYQCYHFMGLKTKKSWLRTCKRTSEVHPLDMIMLMEMPIDSTFFDSDEFKVGVLLSVTETLDGFISIYASLSSFPENFMPIAALLDEVVKQNTLPDLLRKNIENVAELIKKKSFENQSVRLPLQMRKQKPAPLKLLNPKFEEDYVKGRDYDPDRERVERKKLKKLLKKEAKGAARELRKDNYYLFEAKEKDRKILKDERERKYGRALAFLQEQEHAFKSGQLGKGRKRPR